MKRKWYEKYKKLNSAMFNWENSGRERGDAPPYRSRLTSNFSMLDIHGEHGMDQLFKIVGYTEDPPFNAEYPAVAIMFETTDTFKKIWWHYERS